LLRVNRLYGSDPGLATGSRFAAAFRGGCWPDPVSPSQISRWETAAARAGFGVLRRYEELLDLTPNRLVAVADWAYRKSCAGVGPPVLDRGLSPEDPHVRERAEQLLEQALSAELMTGPDWDALTCRLGVLPTVFIFPRDAWADLSERLIAELLISDGSAWLFRVEALARLMAHPRARSSVIAACGALAADPNNQVVIEPLTILDKTTDREANRHVLAQLAHPSSDRALRGALLASIEKVPRRHFGPVQLRSLAGAAADLLDADDLHADARQLAAALLRHVPPAQLGGVRERLRTAADTTTRSILTFGQTAFPDAAEHVTARIQAVVTAQMPGRTPADADPIFAELLGELLFNPNVNQGLLAGRLIAATPYRDPVGAALAAELAAGPLPGPVSLTTAIIAALSSVGRPADRAIVERLVLAPGLPAPVTDAAAWRIGHVSGHSDHRFWLNAVETHRLAWQQGRSPASVPALRGLVYALGIGRQHGLLRRIDADTRLPGQARAAARWWLNIPRRIYSSAAL
jgi:hypothetical protein